jgi:flagellar biosynthesis GTPase FlhF
MARKLKTFTTSAGFFDLAIAAPSMKAALEAWGANSNLFHQGFAKVTDDPTIIAATMAKPGVILRRPVGTKAAFSEHAELPGDFAVGTARRPSATKTPRPKGKRRTEPIDDKAARQAAQAFEREQERRRRQERREEATRERERERRDRAIASAETDLEQARRAHQAKVGEIEKARAALDKRLEAEESRWKKQEEQLESALRRARADHLRLV